MVDMIIAFSICGAPVLFVCWYEYRKDKKDRKDNDEEMAWEWDEYENEKKAGGHPWPPNNISPSGR